MTMTHQEFMVKFDDERKQLLEAILKAITEEQEIRYIKSIGMFRPAVSVAQ